MDHFDARWTDLKGGYRLAYDPRPALRRIASREDVEDSWLELWEELHHQGDVGEASYAAIPSIAALAAGDHRLDWNAYALAATIEMARADPRNPPLPAWMAAHYAQAWAQMFKAGLAALPKAHDETLVGSILAVLAAHKRQPMLARLAMLSEEERQAMLDEVGWA